MKTLAICLFAALSLTACLDDDNTDPLEELPGFPAPVMTDEPDGVVETFEIGEPPTNLPKQMTEPGLEVRFPDENGVCCIVLRYAPPELPTAGRK